MSQALGRHIIYDMRASRLRARKLGDSRMHLVAAPANLRAHGRPRTVADLARHNCLGFCFTPRRGWPFAGETFMPSGNAVVSDGESMRTLVVAGLGIARLAAFHVGPDVEAGRLVTLLDALHPHDSEPVHAVFIGDGGNLPARTRLFLDYLAAETGF